MSATIDDTKTIQRFQDFLKDASGTSPARVALDGSAFPVFVRRMPMDDEADQAANPADPTGGGAGGGTIAKALGTSGNARVLTSLALQQACDILESTTDGNVLVFVAGEADITRSIRTCRTKFQSARGGATDPWDPWSTSASAYGSFWNQSYGSFLGGDDLGFHFILEQDESVSSDGGGSSKEGGWLSGATTALSGLIGGGASRKRQVKVGIYPFHGKLSPAQRDEVINYREDRIIVFTTNYAETGLTIPNVRYVIDTGLERRSSWNPETCMQELVTQRITKSSMLQRTGRAGRVASGICVRLYSEEVEAQLQDLPPPAILVENSQQTVLRLLALQHGKQLKGKSLQMLEPIPKKSWDESARLLKEFNAIDADGKPTTAGKSLLGLGLDHRIGRFLIACAAAKCLPAGTMLAALLSSGHTEKLLPLRRREDKSRASSSGGGIASAAASVAKPKQFEVDLGRRSWEQITDANATAILNKVLSGDGPAVYNVGKYAYEARVDPSNSQQLIQKNVDTGKERKVREKQPAPPYSTAGSGGFGSFDDARARFLDPTGDHWTLLKTFRAFLVEGSSPVKWCQQHGLPFHTLQEAETTHEHIQDTLSNINMDPYKTDFEDWHGRAGSGEPSAELRDALLKCVCAAFYDQLCVPKNPEKLNEGLVRIASGSGGAEAMVRYQRAFQARHGAVAVADPDAVEPTEQAEAPTDGELAAPEEIVMRLRDRSTLWAMPLPKPDMPMPGTVTTQMGTLLIFHSMILTDAGDQTPSMQIISQIKPEWVQEAAPSGWCREVNFAEMMRSTVERASFTVNVGQHGRDIFTRNHGEWLSKMRKRY